MAQHSYVICRFACVISFNQRVARLCVAFAYHGDAASHPSLDEKVDVLISQELKLHSRLFQKSVPAQSWWAEEMRRIQPLFMQANLSSWSFPRHPPTAARPSVLGCGIAPSLSSCVFFINKGSAQIRHVSLAFAIHWSILLSLCGPVIAVFRRAS